METTNKISLSVENRNGYQKKENQCVDVYNYYLQWKNQSPRRDSNLPDIRLVSSKELVNPARKKVASQVF